MTTGLYVFAIVDRDPALQLDPDPTGTPALRIVPMGRLAAVVEDVDVTEYEGDGLQRNLDDPAWLEGAVRRHEQVVDGFLNRVAVVPMRFGSIFSTESGLRHMLTEHAGTFLHLLDQVRDRAEWGVRVTVDPETLARTGSVVGKPRTPTSGKDYLRQRQAQRAAAADVHRLATDVATRIHSRLSEAADRSALLEPRQAQPNLVLSAAYLVPLARTDEFLARVGRVEADQPGAALQVTGPWPAYSFTSADVGGPRR